MAALLAGQAGRPNEYYRTEDTFKQGIKLFAFEIHDAAYLEVNYDAHGFVSKMNWRAKNDSLVKVRTYEYWPDDQSIKRMLEMSPDSLVLRELLFGDEPKSRQFIEHVYGVDFVADFRDRFTEVFYDSNLVTMAYRIMSTRSNQIGAIFFDYDSLGYLTNETWFLGDEMKRIREFRYIFNRSTGDQEVIERGPEGQVVSHIRIKPNPHDNLPVSEPGDSLTSPKAIVDPTIDEPDSE